MSFRAVTHRVGATVDRIGARVIAVEIPIGVAFRPLQVLRLHERHRRERLRLVNPVIERHRDADDLVIAPFASREVGGVRLRRIGIHLGLRQRTRHVEPVERGREQCLECRALAQRSDDAAIEDGARTHRVLAPAFERRVDGAAEHARRADHRSGRQPDPLEAPAAHRVGFFDERRGEFRDGVHVHHATGGIAPLR